MELTKNFSLTEFVSRSTFNQWGNSSTWFLVRDHVEAMQWLRDRLKIRMVINIWNNKIPGPHFWRGLRTPDAPSFKPWSQHSYKMNATDWDSPDMPVAEIYKWLLANQDEIIAKTSIRAVEDINFTARWIHTDSRYIPNAKGIFVVKP